jgi:hypothetical protein
MEGGDNVVAGPLGHIEMPFDVQAPLLEEPILPAGPREERGPLVEDLEGGEDKQVCRGGGGNLIGEGNVNDTGEEVIGEEHELQVVVSGINIITMHQLDPYEFPGYGESAGQSPARTGYSTLGEETAYVVGGSM